MSSPEGPNSTNAAGVRFVRPWTCSKPHRDPVPLGPPRGRASPRSVGSRRRFVGPSGQSHFCIYLLLSRARRLPRPRGGHWRARGTFPAARPSVTVAPRRAGPMARPIRRVRGVRAQKGHQNVDRNPAPRHAGTGPAEPLEVVHGWSSSPHRRRGDPRCAAAADGSGDVTRRHGTPHNRGLQVLG